MEQLLQEMKAVQEKMKFERYCLEQKLKEMKFEFNKKSFTYDCLKIGENEFFLLCGLSVNEFDCLFACLMPFLHLIVYPDCVQSLEKLDSNNKLLDDRTPRCTYYSKTCSGFSHYEDQTKLGYFV